jgi:hypothetical protein
MDGKTYLIADPRPSKVSLGYSVTGLNECFAPEMDTLWGLLRYYTALVEKRMRQDEQRTTWLTRSVEH